MQYLNVVNGTRLIIEYTCRRKLNVIGMSTFDPKISQITISTLRMEYSELFTIYQLQSENHTDNFEK